MRSQSLLVIEGGHRPHAFLDDATIQLKKNGWKAIKREGDTVYYKNTKTGDTMTRILPIK